ncbi:MAG: LacI family transcriptional regulator [Planctomycetaceae bacterium]|nr:LacI family transcriptional regulator [Planctomycetaceae bacterium]
MANITIKDIARAMGVNVATVSRALNDQNGVSDAMRTAIKAKAAALGYRPNALARSLVTSRGSTIAYIAPDLANPYHVEVARAIKDYVRPLGYTLILCDSEWDMETELAQLEYMERQRVEGLIMKSARSDFDHIAARLSCPVAMLSTNYSDTYSTIDTDNFYGGFLAAEALIRCGYTRIGYLGARQDPPTSRQRGAGYKAALQHYGVSYSKNLTADGEFTMEGGREVMRRLWSRKTRPDAVFCVNDICAIGAMDFLLDQGVRIPEDFGIVGFDNMFMSSLSQIQMSTIAQQGYELGTGAAELLMDTIQQRDGHRPEHRIIEPRLILRNTTRPVDPYQPTPASQVRRP